MQSNHHDKAPGWTAVVTPRLSINWRMTSLAMNSGYRFESMQSSGMRHLLVSKKCRLPWPSLTLQIQSFVVCSAVVQIKINQTMVGNSNLLVNAFELADKVFIQSNGDFIFQLSCIKILASLDEIESFSHFLPLRYFD
jgi:hypothetical protein